MKQYCGNCGKTGHIYKHCLAPIISMGIVLTKKKNELLFLLIQRKDTLGFVEFMRGKYNLENVDYIKNLLSIMTKTERQNILNFDFDDLWNKLWMNKPNNQYFNEYENSKMKFYKLKIGYRFEDKFINFEELNNVVECIYLTPEWGFPKGRRNLYESDLNCAKREFQEETGINEIDYNLLNAPCVSELFYGTNNIRYKHIYYLAHTDKDLKVSLDKNNKDQITEISNIAWYNYNDAMNIIRPYNIEKKNALKKINEYLLNSL